MRHQTLLLWTAGPVLLIGLSGCKDRSSPPPATAPAADRDTPAARPDAASDRKVPMSEMMASARRRDAGQSPGAAGAAGALPPGHPPIGATLPAGHPPIGATLPAGHPPIGTMPSEGSNIPPAAMAAADKLFSEPAEPEHMLDMKPPPAWRKQPARRFTVAVYSVPKAAADAEAAEVTVSHYPEMAKITLEQQKTRWASMFEPAGTQPVAAEREYKLDNAAHPTTVVEFSGRYIGGMGGMGAMGMTAKPKDNYRLIAAVAETDAGPWFFKLTGPQASVNQHKDEFLDLIRKAK